MPNANDANSEKANRRLKRYEAGSEASRLMIHTIAAKNIPSKTRNSPFSRRRERASCRSRVVKTDDASTCAVSVSGVTVSIVSCPADSDCCAEVLCCVRESCVSSSCSCSCFITLLTQGSGQRVHIIYLANRQVGRMEPSGGRKTRHNK